jgi:uncharacterized repeat protein (TIGR03803 family)
LCGAEPSGDEGHPSPGQWCIATENSAYSGVQFVLKRFLGGCHRHVRVLSLAMATGLCLVSAPSHAVASLTPLLHFDLHYTKAGVVEGTGGNSGYLFGSTYDTSKTSGGTLFRVPRTGGVPEVIYQLKSTDAYSPRAALLVGSDGYLYGTTHNSARTETKSNSGGGVVFKIAQDGSGFTVLHDFGGATTYLTLDDSVVADFPLLESGGYLYGVAAKGGANSTGTVYRIRMSDGAFTNLHDFAATNSDGSSTEGYFPASALTMGLDGRLYGVTKFGGANLVTTSATTYGAGTIFSVDVDGNNFQSLYSFPALDTTTSPARNEFGANPAGTLVEIASGVFVGTTLTGGAPSDTSIAGYGVVFKFDTNNLSSPISVLYAFDSTNGAAPSGRLGYDGSLIYGVTTGGSSTADPVTSYGNLYSINPGTAEFTKLYSLVAADGYSVVDGVTLGTDGDLYGVTQVGGSCTATYPYTGYGTVFRYSLTTQTSYSSYSNCTQASSSSGAFTAPWLLLFGVFGLVPAVRRRVWGSTRA